MSPHEVEVRLRDGALVPARLALGYRYEPARGKLRMIAGAAVQRFTSLCQRVTDLLSVQAGESQTVVEGTSYAQAKSATILTEDKVSINGKSIYLG